MKITIIAGTGQNMHGAPISDSLRAAAVRAIREYLANIFGGFTETDHTGGWINGAGRLVMEQGKAWTIFTEDSKHAEGAAEYVRRHLMQESVGLAIEPAAVRWIAEDSEPAELEADAA